MSEESLGEPAFSRLLSELSRLPEAYSGKWVIFDEGGMIGSNESLAELLKSPTLELAKCAVAFVAPLRLGEAPPPAGPPMNPLVQGTGGFFQEGIRFMDSDAQRARKASVA